MSELIDIYIKLHIALITLLVPMLIFYINHASEAWKAKECINDKQIEELQKNAQLESGDTNAFKSKIFNIHSQLEKLSTQREKDAKLLNPILQMKKIYGTLLSSFVLIVIDVAVRNNVIPYNQYFSWFLIASSIVMFLITLYFVWIVVKVAIRSKENIENIIEK